MKKSDLVVSLNKAIIEMIKPEYRPYIKDMYSGGSDTDSILQLYKKLLTEIKKEPDDLTLVKDNIKLIKTTFAEYYNKNISKNKKIELLTNNSKVRLDCLDIDEKLELLENKNIQITAKEIFIEY